MKYPIGIQSFERIIEEGYVYVDKTKLVYDLVQNGSVYFLSRPRRFGKSLLVSTLKNYFLGRKELFKGFAIDSLEKEWLEYPVFHLDFGKQNFSAPDALEKTLEKFVADHEDIYGRNRNSSTIGDRFADLLKAAYEKTGRRAVVLVDEYDKPLLDVMDAGDTIVINNVKKRLEDWYRDVLKGFYGVFKAADENLKFVLLTGVTKFSQVSVFSGFNQPNDISMDARYETLCGITKEELHTVFAEPIAELAGKQHRSVEEMRLVLKRQYDGYHFSEEMADVYNPFSIINAFAKMKIDDYWFRTGTPTYLVRLLRHCNENINELVGRYYDTQSFVDYKADVERPLPMIYQSGYLTIKKYNQRRNTYLLDFPNDEVKKGFVTLLAADYLEAKESQEAWVQDTVDALEEADLEKFRRLLTSFLSSIPYTMRRKDDERERERYFQYTFYLLLRMVSIYTVFVEKQQSEGRVDCVVETDNDIFIFEFKLDGTADEALAQIEAKGYACEYEGDRRPVHKIGCGFSSETGTVGSWRCE
ncbi:MAG: ATP-binding protein [Prevotellaceae bacterium]|nr:ATP-binding protein [Prevotellaceae bacterium]